jgi:hypothetical protein
MWDSAAGSLKDVNYRWGSIHGGELREFTVPTDKLSVSQEMFPVPHESR